MKDNQTDGGIRATDENLIPGAQNQDQLNEFNQNAATTGGNGEKYGATPSVGDNESGAEDDTGNASGSELGGITNLSLDQLKERGDNNS